MMALFQFVFVFYLLQALVMSDGKSKSSELTLGGLIPVVHAMEVNSKK